MNLFKDITDILMHFYTTSGIMCAILLMMFWKKGDRARLFLAITFGLSGLAVLIYYLFKIPEVNPYDDVLAINKMNIGLMSLLMFYLYPIEVIKPRWLTIKRVLMLLSPWILLTLWTVVCKSEFRPLHSFGDVVQYGAEFNVIIRLIILALTIPFSLILLYIHYNWSKSRVNYRWIILFTVGMQIISILYILIMLTGNMYFGIMHKMYCFIFGLIITYQELFLRISVYDNNTSESDSHNIKMGVVNIKPIHSSPIWDRLIKVMETEAVWRNPDLTLVELAKMLGTNRTTLSILIRAEGYDNFYSLINSFRIKEFLYIINNYEIQNINETFYDVGFRSKTTALRYFRKETGFTPSGYLQHKMLIKS